MRPQADGRPRESVLWRRHIPKAHRARIPNFIRAVRDVPYYLQRPMKFPAGILPSLCAAMCLSASPAVLRAEPARPKAAIPVVAETVYSPTDLAALRKRLGRRVVLEGKIVAMGSSRSGSTSYLNFTKNHHDSVSLVFLGMSGAKGIAKQDLAAFVGKTIHVGGLLEDWNGALQVRVFELEQIKVLP